MVRHDLPMVGRPLPNLTTIFCDLAAISRFSSALLDRQIGPEIRNFGTILIEGSHQST
jgi:hypothetical protein